MTNENRRPRALVVVGAGASVEYGIPATAGFGDLIEAAVASDDYCRHTGGDAVYRDVRNALTQYYGKPQEAHFERIYHVMHELARFEVTPGAIARFRPVMRPFLELVGTYPEHALRAACSTMLRAIYQKVSSVCAAPRVPYAPLTRFFERLERQWIPRVYTTNYDDFIGQATGDRYFTGFDIPHADHLRFDGAAFWSRWNQPGLFHLHGSVHMGFPRHSTDIGDIGWYPSRDEASMVAEFSGSGVDRMDGTSIDRGAIITGLDKLGRLQQSPYCFYYAGLSRDVMEADVVFVLGSGLADLHLNTWLKQVRRLKPTLPLLYVGWWDGDTLDLYNAFNADYGDLEIALHHELGLTMHRVAPHQYKAVDGWTIDADSAGAVWADGFQSFLAHPQALDDVLERLGASRTAVVELS